MFEYYMSIYYLFFVEMIRHLISNNKRVSYLVRR